MSSACPRKVTSQDGGAHSPAPPTICQSGREKAIKETQSDGRPPPPLYLGWALPSLSECLLALVAAGALIQRNVQKQKQQPHRPPTATGE
jgi:hypothetical protein